MVHGEGRGFRRWAPDNLRRDTGYRGVGRYFLFHHDPARDDAGVAAIEDRAKELFENAEAAREGRVIELSASATRAA